MQNEGTVFQEELVENPFADDIFAGGATSYAVIMGSNIAITLATPRWNRSKSCFEKVVVGRLVLPIPGAQALAMELFDFLKKKGLDAASTAKGASGKQ